MMNRREETFSAAPSWMVKSIARSETGEFSIEAYLSVRDHSSPQTSNPIFTINTLTLDEDSMHLYWLLTRPASPKRTHGCQATHDGRLSVSPKKDTRQQHHCEKSTRDPTSAQNVGRLLLSSADFPGSLTDIYRDPSPRRAAASRPCTMAGKLSKKSTPEPRPALQKTRRLVAMAWGLTRM